MDIYRKANDALKQSFGENASFYEGQYEAIEAVLTKKKNARGAKDGLGKVGCIFYLCQTDRWDYGGY